jgi:hypothetical protein
MQPLRRRRMAAVSDMAAMMAEPPLEPRPPADPLRERLQHSRAQIFALARALKGEEPPPGAQQSAAGPAASGFPRSRVMRALLSERGRMMLGGAALLVGVTRPKVIWRLMWFAPLLRPLAMRYLLPRFLRH